MATFLDLIGQNTSDSLLSMLNTPKGGYGGGENDVLATLNRPRPDYFTMGSAVKRPGGPSGLYASPSKPVTAVRPQFQPAPAPVAPMTNVNVNPGAPSITQRFQEPTDLAASGYHKGIDLGVAEGTPIGAMDYGTVVGVGFDPDYGNFVRVQHEWGESLYGHGSQTQVQMGMQVERGQPVMLSGSSGKSTGPHLHIETADHQGNLLDPISVADMIGQQYMGLGNVTPMTPEELAAEGL